MFWPIFDIGSKCQERHAAHYLIVNLCSERAYSLDAFHGNCARYPFPDHNPPALELILPCCARMHRFLQADHDNVVAIHCKAGKGRTGLIVVSYLLYCGFKSSAADARKFYDWARTVDGKGLTIISQIRYVHYFEQQLSLIKHGRELLRPEQSRAPLCSLHRVRIHTVPHFNKEGGCDPWLRIEVKSEQDHELYCVFQSPSIKRLSYDLSRHGSQDPSIKSRASLESVLQGAVPAPPQVVQSDKKDISTELDPATGTRIAGDFKVTIIDEGSGKEIFFFWLHSGFLLDPPPEMGGKSRKLEDEECALENLPTSSWSLVLSKHEIDRAAKDTRCAHFDPDFQVELFFKPLTGESSAIPFLDAAKVQKSASMRIESSGDQVERPLQDDKDGYERYKTSASAQGLQEMSFQAWLLSCAPESAESAASNASASTAPSPFKQVPLLVFTGRA